MRRPRRPMLVAAAAFVLTAGLTAAAVTPRGAPVVPEGPGIPVADSASASVSGIVATLQTRLRDYPRDSRAWAMLGLAYVESARVTADPTFYPKAEAALQRSAALAP